MLWFWKTRYHKIRAFGSDIVENYLRERDIRYFRNEQGHYLFFMPAHPDLLPREAIHIIVAPRDSYLAMMAIFPPSVVSWHTNPVELANEWNNERVFPRAHFKPDVGYIMDWFHDFTRGISQAQFDNHIDAFLAVVAMHAQELFEKSRQHANVEV
ncbi:MAG: YbjN domain-containing protein [Gemmatales bacterium]|nr:YbjN domain-containing protein [Gemmatales bacterium]MDW7994643.1 YbjN domain-containing protein [Gemmatales bacterium]